MEFTNRFITITRHIDGFPVESDFELNSETLRLSGSDNIVVKALYLSMDPYQINRFKTSHPSKKDISFAPSIIPGQAIDCLGVGEVVASGNPKFEKGDLVSGIINWAEYSVVKSAEGSLLKKIDNLEFPLSYHLGIFGIAGLTAYAGLFEVGKVKKGEKVFVSAASGSVGNLVGQFAKLHGCYVVGCAGTNQKVALLKEKLGFDDAFNYKEENDFKLTLERYFPDGIDVYFDNVGGEMLEAAIATMNPFGRVSVCGVISEYTDSKKRASPNMVDVVYKRITIQGFLCRDYFNIIPNLISMATDYLRSDKVQILEDISIGVENIPLSFIALFQGDNIGKKITKIADLSRCK